MKKALLLFISIIVTNIVNGQNWNWVKQGGGNYLGDGGGFTIDAYDHGNAISKDSLGNIYITGSFADTAVFGSIVLPGSSTDSATTDIFVAKYDTTGNVIWAKKAGGPDFDYGYGIATNNAGESFVCGSFVGTATFGSYTITGSGQWDFFVAKFDSNGNVIWVKKANFPAWNDPVRSSISLDGLGNIYVTGAFIDTATFDNVGLSSYGSYDIFIAKYNANGNLIWAKNAGSSSNDAGKSIGVDSIGNIFITGTFYGTALFDTVNIVSSGSEDIFLAKYNTNGNILWAKRAGGSNGDYGNALCVDSAGNCFLTGSFRYTSTFNGNSLTAVGNDDIFIAKYDGNGNLIWITADGKSSSSYYGLGIGIDVLSNCYVTGQSNDSIFLAKFDINGNLIWKTQTGGYIDSYSYGRAVTVSNNDCYMTGTFGGNVIFGNTILQSWGVKNIFVGRIGSPILPIAGFVLTDPTICQEDTINFYDASSGPPLTRNWIFPGGSPGSSSVQNPFIIYNSPGTYDVILIDSNALGYDTLILPNYITVYPNPVPTILANSDTTFCIGDSVVLVSSPASSYYWFYYNWYAGDTSQSISIYGSGNYSVLTTDTYGCSDTSNVVHTNTYPQTSVPTIYNNNSSGICKNDSITLTSSTSNSYLWNNGDTTQSITVNYSDSFIVTITDINGCTNSSAPFYVSVYILPDTNIYQSLDTLFVNYNNINATYQWITCNGISLLGQTDQIFIPVTNGSYAVVVTDNYNYNNCSDTSACINVNWFGICNAYFTLYPDTVPHNWLALNQATGISPINYYWSWGDGDTSMGATPSHTYSDSGYYNICLTIEDSTGCIDTYCDSSTYINKKENAIISISVILQSTTITEQTNTTESIKVIPNPSSGNFKLRSDNIESLKIKIYNTIGEIIYESDNSISDIDLSKQPKGIYFLVINSLNKVFSKKLLIQ